MKLHGGLCVLCEGRIAIYEPDVPEDRCGSCHRAYTAGAAAVRKRVCLFVDEVNGYEGFPNWQQRKLLSIINGER